VDTFVYQPLPGRIVFGAGASRIHLAPELERLGARRALLIAASAERALADELVSPLGARVAGTFGDVRPHVPLEVAQAARHAARDVRADCLISVGGGSTTGAAKAVALELGIPIAAIPTTYAGSEMTPIYGITDGRRKRTGTSAAVVPRLVIYDPELTFSLPPPITASSAMNAMAHAIEALYAPGANPVTALVAEEAIRALADGMPRAVADPSDPHARYRTLWGAYLAASALAVAGTSIHHKICHVLGGAYDLPHAELHAIILPHVVASKEREAPALMARVATALATDSAALALHSLVEQVPVPHALADIGLDDADLDEAAALLADELVLDPTEARQILAAAHAGARPTTSAAIP
jgi:maleylacetate reductase